MTREELINVFKYIVKKCDMLINDTHYEADAYTQDIVEDIAELCNHILDGDYGELVEAKENHVEYIRTDAFIEKACKWIDATFHETSIDGWGGENVDVVMSETSVYKDDLINAFRNYMKGK